ncbi:hypothetical protein HMPREF9104_02017 [Lentilactobacillus kisonensis F0435]|uniref:Uncharacterized protein n=1 Tax=Lentilactobacillus kisonensis F0435 TaxID=797516 RepID=H1LHC7_9LACO|nr:hypothetical protein HMPREF9104_02017 [Lentilactobacillus kisonensis F0435]
MYSEHRRIGFDKVRVERLVAHHLLVVSEDSNNNALKILSDGSIEYDEASVNWHVWVTDDSDDNSRLLDELKNPNKINLLSDQEADDIYLQLARKELLKIFVMELETHRFDINSTDVSNLEIAIDHWLAFLTPAQIYAVIWRSVRHVNDERTKGTLGNYKYHLIHFIIKEGDYLITYLSDQGEEIKPYNFPRKVEKDLDTIIFFDQMIFLPNWFARKVPLSQGIVEMKNPRCLVGNTLEKISMQRITNLESIVAIVQDARWFKETDYGVVVNDGNVSWLFAEQLEVFNLMKAKGAVVNSHSRWLPEEFDYCINDFYSFRFIRHLLQALKNSTALNVTEDKSTMW